MLTRYIAKNFWFYPNFNEKNPFLHHQLSRHHPLFVTF